MFYSKVIGFDSDRADHVVLAPNEVITEADVYVDTDDAVSFYLVVGLTFRTNLGHEYGPYGWTTGAMYTSRGSRLNGMIVYGGEMIDNITFLWECNRGICFIGILTDFYSVKIKIAWK